MKRVRGPVLAVDVGNSEIAIGLGDARGWRGRWRLQTAHRRTADEYEAWLSALMAEDRHDPSEVEGVVVSSVVPHVTAAVVEACEALTARRPLVVTSGVRTGMAVRYDPPTSLGSDRLADAVAARAHFGSPVVVVDFGTATTFNVVGPDGAFHGGAIAPGIGVAAEALARAGARLHRIELAAPPLSGGIGRSTEQSTVLGLLHGWAGLVVGLLARIDRELAGLGAASPAPAVATGGRAPLVAPLVPRLGAILPDLTLDGLRLIYEASSP